MTSEAFDLSEEAETEEAQKAGFAAGWTAYPQN